MRQVPGCDARKPSGEQREAEAERQTGIETQEHGGAAAGDLEAGESEWP